LSMFSLVKPSIINDYAMIGKGSMGLFPLHAFGQKAL